MLTFKSGKVGKLKEKQATITPGIIGLESVAYGPI